MLTFNITIIIISICLISVLKETNAGCIESKTQEDGVDGSEVTPELNTNQEASTSNQNPEETQNMYHPSQATASNQEASTSRVGEDPDLPKTYFTKEQFDLEMGALKTVFDFLSSVPPKRPVLDVKYEQYQQNEYEDKKLKKKQVATFEKILKEAKKAENFEETNDEDLDITESTGEDSDIAEPTGEDSDFVETTQEDSEFEETPSEGPSKPSDPKGKGKYY